MEQFPPPETAKFFFSWGLKFFQNQLLLGTRLSIKV